LVALARERPRSRALLATAGLVVGAAVVAALPIGGPTDAQRRGTAHYNLALTQESRGQLDAALASYRRAVAADPSSVQAHVNLGGLLARSGAFAEAIAEERAALALRPEDVIAHVDLANALLQIGRLGEAEAHYRWALRLDPREPHAQAGLEAIRDQRARAAAP
jgi:Flp pilus assembly protein TadD